MKRTGLRCCELDRRNFKGIFLGYTATDQNIIYLDLDSGMVKSSHHAQFDAAWYLQPTRPPAAQLLYELGILPETDPLEDDLSSLEASVTQVPTDSISFITVPWPPSAPHIDIVTKWYAPPMSKHLHLPLRTLTVESLQPTRARTALTKPTSGRNLAAELVKDFQLGFRT